MLNGTYKCAICGKSYHTIEGRIACETECLKKRKAEEAIEAKKKLEEEKKKIKQQKKESEQAIEAKLDEVNKMLKDHFNKYKDFEMTHEYYYLNYMFNRFLFWF